jgi:branched-chain amino acid transport system substrate-binding protein
LNRPHVGSDGDVLLGAGRNETTRKPVMTTRLLLIGLLALGWLGATSVAAETIKIGDINSYTRMAQHTEHAKRGMTMAIAEINDAGGIGGKLLELISRDDAGEPGEAIRVAEELVTREGVEIITGTTLSNVGLAVASFAEQNRVLYLATEPLADAVTLQSGNRYTFRLRPSTWMQSAMLAEIAAEHPAVRWATIAPNYAYGQEAVAAFKALMSEKRPDIEWVGEQWPALFNIDAGAEVQALAAARPEAIFNVTFSADLARFVREGHDRGLFENTFVASLLTGEPEYLDPLEDEAPEDWLVTGYPWDVIDDPVYVEWLDAYRARFDDYPRIGSIVGYNSIRAIGAALEATGGSTDVEELIEAMRTVTFATPQGELEFRAIDHQATLGAWVGYTTVVDGRGTMRDWFYADGVDYLPPVEMVLRLRPASD